ncbi:unnamed protein product [Prunus brigantina]
MKCKLKYCLSSTQVMLLHEGELFDVILIANEVVILWLDEPDQSKLWTTWGKYLVSSKSTNIISKLG